jgi:hypothetical protein
VEIVIIFFRGMRPTLKTQHAVTNHESAHQQAGHPAVDQASTSKAKTGVVQRLCRANETLAQFHPAPRKSPRCRKLGINGIVRVAFAQLTLLFAAQSQAQLLGDLPADLFSALLFPAGVSSLTKMPSHVSQL